MALQFSIGGIRAWLEEHNLLVIAVVVVVIIVAVVVILKHTLPASHNTSSYFIDEETMERSVRPSTDYPPLLGKSGRPTVVEAIYMTCTTCADSRISYLLKYTDRAKQTLEDSSAGNSQPLNAAVGMGDMLVRSPSPGSQWVNATTAEGQKIMDTAPNCGNASAIKVCLP